MLDKMITDPSTVLNSRNEFMRPCTHQYKQLLSNRDTISNVTKAPNAQHFHHFAHSGVDGEIIRPDYYPQNDNHELQQVQFNCTS